MFEKKTACNIKAKGCFGEFIKRTFWQTTCDNKECQKERNRRNAKTWYSEHKEQRRRYRRAYALL